MSEDYYNYIEEIIDSKDTEYIKKQISYYDKKLKRNIVEHVKFFGQLIQVLVRKESSCNIILSSIRGWDNLIEIDKILVKISTDFSCNRDELKYVINCISVPSIMVIFDNILRDDTICNLFPVSAENILYSYDTEFTIPMIDKLLKLSKKLKRKKSIEYLLRKKQNIADFAKKPHWVSLKEGEGLADLSTTTVGKPQEIIENELDILKNDSNSFIESMFKRKDIDFKKKLSDKDSELDVKEVLQIYLSTLGQNEIYRGDKLMDIRKMNRVWGPINAIEGTNCFHNPDNSGPCRMFICKCREEDEWFEGNCNTCQLRIKNLSHAIRFPLKKGGWSGCFCSFNCMLENPPEPMDLQYEVAIKILETDLINHGVMDRHH